MFWALTACGQWLPMLMHGACGDQSSRSEGPTVCTIFNAN